MVRRIGGEERSFRAGQAVGEGGTGHGAVTMATADEARAALHRLTQSAWHGLRTGMPHLNGDRARFSVPPQPTDDDVLLRAVIDERDALTAALADAETRAARDAVRLAAADNIAHMSPLYDDMSSEEVVVLRCVFCEGQEDGMNRVFLHADDCPWQALAATPRPDAGQGEG